MLPSGEKEREGSTLSLRNVSRLDSGVYICSAANGVDRAVTARIQLKVICEFRSFVLLFALTDSRPGSQLLHKLLGCLCLVQSLYVLSPCLTWDSVVSPWLDTLSS